MAAFRGINLRSGDLAEQLGLLLIQNFALVTPVPRTEDVGIDAVVTLLREHDSSRLIASDSFFLQLKSRSVGSVNFTGEQVKWLYDLELPYFVGSVDRNSHSIRLYCCHALSDAFITNHARSSICIQLESEYNPLDFFDSDSPDVPVGPPIMEWSFSQVLDPAMQKMFFEICRAHIDIYRKGMEHRRVGMCPIIGWTTNAMPKEGFWKTARSHKPGEFIDDLSDLMMPYVSAMIDECMRAKEPYWLQKLKSLSEEGLQVIDVLKRNGQKEVTIPAQPGSLM